MQLWKPGTSVEILDLGHGYYLVKFTSLVDLEKVITRGPWMVYDHYLTLNQWFPEFRPECDHLVKTMAWIRLPGLPLMYYDDDLLITFASAIGKPVKIDLNTSEATRALFECVWRLTLGSLWFRWFISKMRLLKCNTRSSIPSV
ncbi:hypothetical protein Tsubulata_005731 [Turnera subulata]|uniref:DUF4283 domain-containing protein n=1 Tax=Turnera subulata TaxID=218843 RepID=A0A9Q0G8M1_9ROSI|nr:hypothetical protein Tsubulata_005731 [Turnera subulata]